MPSPPPSQPRRRPWHWLTGFFLTVLVFGSSWTWAWKTRLRYQAASELRAAGFYPGREDAWQIARADWRGLFKRETWHVEPEAHWVRSAGVPPLRSLTALVPAFRRLKIEVLYIRGCPDLQNMDGLADLPALKTLTLIDCPALQNVDGLQRLTALQSLSLEDCNALKNMDTLQSLTALEKVTVVDCRRLSTDSIDALKTALPHTTIIDPGIRPTARLGQAIAP